MAIINHLVRKIFNQRVFQNLHICTSAHLHIRTFPHLHIRTFAHPHIQS